jgi:undecaprenyl phosphate-alpha-L-ara4N flippase subunit ArnE
MNYLAIIVLGFSSCLGAAGQIFFKLGASGAVSLFDFINFRVAMGLFCYGCGTFLWVWALSKVALNVAYSFTALTFILVFGASGFLLNEKVTVITMTGLLFIATGFFLVVTGSK